MPWRGYDFLVWTSWPSSAKVVNDQGKGWVWWGALTPEIGVSPGDIIVIDAMVRQQDVLYSNSEIATQGWDGEKWVRVRPKQWDAHVFKLGSFD